MRTTAKELAADTRDPIAMLVFTALGIAGSLGLIPEGVTVSDLAMAVGYLMGFVAAFYSFLHHKDFKLAIRAGREMQEIAAKQHDDDEAAPKPIANLETTPTPDLDGASS